MRRVEDETQPGEVRGDGVKGIGGQVEDALAAPALGVQVRLKLIAQVVCRGPVPEVDVLDDPQG